MTDQTLLHRQVHPNFIENFTVSAQAFMNGQMTAQSSIFVPRKDDNGQLSVYNGDKFTPQEAFEHFVEQFKTKGVLSCGVLSVSKEECESMPDISVAEDNNPFDGHSHIDFSAVESNGKIKKRAATLRDFAIKREWQYVPKKQ